MAANTTNKHVPEFSRDRKALPLLPTDKEYEKLQKDKVQEEEEDEEEYHLYAGLKPIPKPRTAKPQPANKEENKAKWVRLPYFWWWSLVAALVFLYICVIAIIIYLVVSAGGQSLSHGGSGMASTNASKSGTGNVPSQDAGKGTATFLMECTAPAGIGGNSGIDDLCWQNNVTLVLVQYRGQRVLRCTIDFRRRTCSFEVVDRGYRPRRLACQRGSVAVIGAGWRIWFYNPGGRNTNWKPDGVMLPWNIAYTQDHILVSNRGGPLTLFTTAQRSLFQIEGSDQYEFNYIHLHSQGLFVGTTVGDEKFLIGYNLGTTESLKVGGKGSFLKSPTGVCTLPGENILVCDRDNDRISMLDAKGGLINHLVINGRQLRRPVTIDVMPRRGEPSLMVVGDVSNKVSIYALDL